MRAREAPTTKPSGDPNQALGYIVAGLLLYGGLGWLADRWWGTSFMVVIGILLGAGLGFWMVFRTFAFRGEPGETTEPAAGTSPTDTPGDE